METNAIRANVILLTKDGEPAVVVLPNGHTKHYKVEEMNVKDYEDFYEVDKARQD